MPMFMTKVWGFGEPVGPLQFSTSGWRERAIRELKPGDLVLLVGTMGEQTPKSEQGCLLGLMEPTSERVAALDFLEIEGPNDLDENGNYRWPFGLLNRRAWRLDEPRVRLTDISDRNFNMDSALGIVPLTKLEEELILALPRSISTLVTSFRTDVRIHGVAETRRRGAPPPSFTRRSVMGVRHQPAETYVFKLAGAQPNSFKVGWAIDSKVRMRTFNQSAMPSLGGLNYKGFLIQPWSTATKAFRMEQELLRQFRNRQNAANREIISGVSDSEFESAWTSLLYRFSRS